MAENLNEYFSSVFTREDTSAETKFEGRESRLFSTTNCNTKNGS